MNPRQPTPRDTLAALSTAADLGLAEHRARQRETARRIAEIQAIPGGPLPQSYAWARLAIELTAARNGAQR